MDFMATSQKMNIKHLPETPFSLTLCMTEEFSGNILALMKIVNGQESGSGSSAPLSCAISLAKMLQIQAQSSKDDEGDFIHYLQSPVRGNHRSQFLTQCAMPFIGMQARSFSETVEVIAAHIAATLDLMLTEPDLPAPPKAPRWSMNSHVGAAMVDAYCRLLSITAEDSLEVFEELHSGTLRQRHASCISDEICLTRK